MSPWQKLLERPSPREHLLQLCDVDGQALANNVSHYLLEGLNRGDGLLVIATEEHREAFCRCLEKLGADPKRAIESGQLSLLDAEEMLARFMRNGQPDWDLFESAIGSTMRKVRRAADSAGLRAYGEMVGILWQSRQFSAAIRLEQFWNKLLSRSSFSLFCGYSMDVFGKEFQASALDALLCAHTHLVPGETNRNLELALNRAMEEVLGRHAQDQRLLAKADSQPSWAFMPSGEALVLWLRKNYPESADAILARARRHYRIQTEPLFA